MKKKLAAACLAAAMAVPMMNSLTVKADTVSINASNFPDAAFRTYITDNIDDGDGILDYYELAYTTDIQASFMGIENLTGIKYFSNLEVLGCEGSSFTTLDVSGMTSLRQLNLGFGALTSINIDGCTALTELSCWGNHFTTVDLSGAPNLTYADFNSNELTAINVASNTRLNTLWLNNNPSLTSIDVTHNSELEKLYVNGCALTSLNVAYNSGLTELMFGSNNIGTIDLSHNSGLQVLDFSNTGMRMIDLQSNGNIQRFICFGNPCNDYYVGSNSIIFTAINSGNLMDDFDGHYLYEYESGELYIEVQCDPEDTLRPGQAPDVGTPTPTPTAAPTIEVPVTEAPTTAPVGPTSAPVNPTAAPTNAPDTSGVAGFVNRLYRVVFDRDADQAGLDYWVDALVSGRETGVSASYGFITSREYLDLHYNDRQYVESLYQAYFGRSASEDPAGVEYWVGTLDSGASRETVFSGFANSQEFYELCVSYGILAGTFMPGYNYTQVAKTNLFVDRLYSIILSRNCDKDGMVYWTDGLMKGSFTGAGVAEGFIFSDEYRTKNNDDETFIIDLYKAVMGREPDSAGVSYWLGVLQNGSTDKDIFNGYICSPEFEGICRSYGIVKGDPIYAGLQWARIQRGNPSYNIEWYHQDTFASYLGCELTGYNNATTVNMTLTRDGVLVYEGPVECSEGSFYYGMWAPDGEFMPSGTYTATFYSQAGTVLGTSSTELDNGLNYLTPGAPRYFLPDSDCYQLTGEWFIYGVENDEGYSDGIIPSYCSHYQITATADPSYNERLVYTWYYSSDDDFDNASQVYTGIVSYVPYGSSVYAECDNNSDNASRSGYYWCVVYSEAGDIYVVMSAIKQ